MTLHVGSRPLTIDPRLAWTTVRLEIHALPSPVRRWFAFIGALLAVGGVAAVISLPPGDEVFGTTPAFEWGLLISSYVFFVVTTSGLCLVSGLGEVFGVEPLKPIAKRAVVLALSFLLAGFFIIGLDLHWPIRLVFGVILSPSPASAMWWMGVLYSVYLVLLLVELGAMLLGFERIARACGAMCMVTAIAAPSTLGGVFGVLASRPFWSGSFMPAYMVLTAVLSGAAVLGLVFSSVNLLGPRGRGPGTARVAAAVRWILAGACLVVAVYTAWQVLGGLGSPLPAARAAAQAELGGPLGLQFWAFKVGVGLVLPLLILALAARRPWALPAASTLVLAGLFVDRLTFVSSAQVAPSTAASGIVSSPYATYAPSLVEIGIVVGAVGIVLLLYSLAEWFLDLTVHHPAASLNSTVPELVPVVALPEQVSPGSAVGASELVLPETAVAAPEPAAPEPAAPQAAVIAPEPVAPEPVAPQAAVVTPEPIAAEAEGGAW